MGNINISQFYIKLNKKLIVEIEKVDYKSQKDIAAKNSFDSLKRSLELFPNVIKYFKTIDIETLNLNDNKFSLFYDNNSLYLDNKYINISSKLRFLGSNVNLDIYSLYLKDMKLLFNGKVKVDYNKEYLNYHGKYFYEDLQGDVIVDMNKKLAKFYLDSNKFKSLKFIKKFINLPFHAESWMYDNVKGDIKLDFLYAEYDIQKKELIEKSLNGKAQVTDARVKFHKSLKPIVTKRVDIDFDKGDLSFDLKQPKYEQIDIQGSKVVIENLISREEGVVKVNIKSKKIRLNDDVLDILKAYKIDIPVNQISGYTKANLELEIPYMLSKKEIKTNGYFEVFDSNIKVGEFEFYTKDAKVILDAAMIKLRGADFKYNNMLQSNVNMDLNTKTLKATGIIDIKKLLLVSNKEEILNIKNSFTDFDINFSNPIKIDLINFDTTISIDENINIDINNIKKLYASSQLLKDNSIKDGNLSIKYQNENSISFQGLVGGLDYPLYKNEKLVTKFDITGDIKENEVIIRNQDNDLKVVSKRDSTTIYLEDYFVDLTKLKTNESLNIDSVLNVQAKDLKLKVDENSSYDLSHLTAKILNKDNITFNTNVKNLELPLLKDDKKVDTLSLSGSIKGDLVTLKTDDNALFVEILDNKALKLIVNGYDLKYNLSQKENSKIDFEEVDLKASNSTLILNDKFRFLGDNYEVQSSKDSIFFHLEHNKTDITYKEEDKEIDIYANNIDDEFINELFGKKVFSGGKLMLVANQDTQNNLKGKIILSNTKIEDLAIINNLLIFIHTSPGLLNPLLAVPSVVGMASKDGFNLNGYRIIDGVIEFNYDRKKDIINAHKIVTVGNGIDFDGSAVIDLDNNTINSDMRLIFFKDYSNIVSSVPVLNYVLLGESKRVSTKVNIFGDINNPKIKTNLTKDAFSVPLNIGKRILESPGKFLDLFRKDNKEK
ncbi:MAG: AsmA-like C-terminal domain-containing protein [Campylobacterota bacterium]